MAFEHITPKQLKDYLKQAIDDCQLQMDKVHQRGFDMSHPDYLQNYGAKWAYRHILKFIETGVGNANNRND